MRRINQILHVAILILFVATLCSAAKQQELKNRLFKNVNTLFNQARSEQADLLSPTIYNKAVQKNEQALADFEKGKNIEKLLSEAEALLHEALENAKLGKITFPHLLTAREDALAANAPQYALDLYTKAEREFLESAKEIEKGDVKKAKERAVSAEKIFRESELLSIKSSIIGSVNNFLNEAKGKSVDKYSPITFSLASALLSESETILNSDKAAKTEARQKAEEAEYEARHAIHLADNIKTLKEDDKNWEKLILIHEKYFATIIRELNFIPQFDDGFEGPTTSVVAAITNLKDENKRLNKEVIAQGNEIDKLNDEINKLNAELNATKEQQAGLQEKLDLGRKKEEKYKKVENLFVQKEAHVLRVGDDVTLRLVGLNFPSGKSTINPVYFSLLSKVQRAIQVFPEYHVTVEGHTDSQGNDSYNEKLSMDRAAAVREYLIANLGLNRNQITAIGYGESRPIASNETPNGREQNRRIDIVLSPGTK